MSLLAILAVVASELWLHRLAVLIGLVAIAAALYFGLWWVDCNLCSHSTM